ncbi:GntR family transcriptional regulator [Coraliomargarita algicola]|uniref:GntR family transcriptional regulator n=1 Tax=Coraliomargarita algicola TaxID=3092156 RepID=A0ABZ0RP23_9BACT|nr:GntR family transcriptional regulator [Coraliomargarita sp. J2-16]WPJ96715.1 GntR family transcriptional regulator [Coraliomargarita sp. J2-16]
MKTQNPTAMEAPQSESLNPALDISLTPKRSVPEQLAERLREKILSGEMPAGLRLPTTQQLAKQWGTYVPAVHAALSQLAKEGLLDRRHRKGTFVKESESKLSRIGIMASNQLWHDQGELLFSRELFLTLEKYLISKNIRATVWFENRKGKKSGTPPPALKKAIQKNEVQAIITLNAGQYNAGWLNELPLPVAGINAQLKHHVSFSETSFYEKALTALKKEGCQTAACICAIPPESPDLEKHRQAFQLALEKHQITTRPEWNSNTYEHPKHHDEYGFEKFTQLWGNQEKPDGLIVYPDTTAKGVMLGLSTHGVEIPNELSVAFHKNAEIPFLCPFPINMVENSCLDCVEALVNQLIQIHNGESPNNTELEYKVSPQYTY